MSDQVLLEKLDQTTETLSVKLAELIRLSGLDNGVEETDGNENNIDNQTDLSIATTGVTIMNTQNTQLIKGVQDLLTLTRSIREKWLLNQIPEQDEGPKDSLKNTNHEGLESLLDKSMKEIVGEDAMTNI
ncbi:hypothetical protein KAFR_0G02850 [Kazachstania africana CBS 2517]|uniref:Mediator of RNA polymerase II transcription subunit 22 n=1 Tax=Kazachstania africana (strain ATCC 22294 / BCRC 22015 / CBS 2517 / CECT 1963 / NBRC 1671 / NRRL Y-8276) TaxID=1071382 RepID=H2AY67_KAZAF|nr:hypothetical protein KAFR_0G02850 [Kazachstania africana CBS 2517]CCF59317.1 hypothetical protein KAFR_0G02850 [Kazachstania africana CBS 2517]